MEIYAFGNLAPQASLQSDNVVWGIDFSARRRQELDQAISNLVEFAKAGEPPLPLGAFETEDGDILYMSLPRVDPPCDCA